MIHVYIRPTYDACEHMIHAYKYDISLYLNFKLVHMTYEYSQIPRHNASACVPSQSPPPKSAQTLYACCPVNDSAKDWLWFQSFVLFIVCELYNRLTVKSTTMKLS